MARHYNIFTRLLVGRQAWPGFGTDADWQLTREVSIPTCRDTDLMGPFVLPNCISARAWEYTNLECGPTCPGCRFVFEARTSYRLAKDATKYQSADESAHSKAHYKVMNRTVITVVDDMFFAAKIRAAAEHFGITLRSVRNADLLINVARESAPDLIIVDLHSEKVDPLEIARTLKADEQLRSVPLLGFFSHVQTELQRAAQAAGYDLVVPRSVFSRDLGEILEGKKDRKV